MKKLIVTVMCVLAVYITAFAQTESNKTETFKVYGNCGMCKKTIESALKKKDGILSGKWDSKTKMVVVTYDSSKINIKQIYQKIANAGYDTDSVRANDEAYSNLHSCCQYDRPKKTE
ncbi:MAG: hypothetical protein A3K10_07000 [Bacteroidetes bacterium RIFCSPLOWO2_12_FULL_31_6]|nr:MAG: hypothetical protein A3K10_07000 [Bacteroidetes bacterium RIFCSPLOWO2_12_FULL_31_6]